jgi:hypothetical protein
MSALVIEIEPLVEPVSLVNMKNYLRLEIDNDDFLINGLIVAAREHVEAFTGLSLVQKGYRQSLDSFPYYTDTVMSQQAYPPSYYSLPRYSTTLWNYSQMIKLFAPPLVAVTSISYFGTDTQWHSLTLVPQPWYPNSAYTNSPASSVLDVNGNLQQCITPGNSAYNPPNWSQIVPVGNNPGGITTETTGVAWINIGPDTQFNAPQNLVGSYIVDSDSHPARIFPWPPGGFWPPVEYVPNAVQIHFIAGFSPDASKVPQVCVTAIMMAVSNWYENRTYLEQGRPQELPKAVEQLLWTKRILDYSPTRG